MRKQYLTKIILYVLLLGTMLGLTSCISSAGKDTETQETNSETVQESDLYLVVAHDMQEEAICLYSFETGVERYYDYGFSTQFKDKYGKFTTAAEFSEGRCVTIGPRDKDGYLTEVVLSDEVWEYEKVRRFEIDEEKGILTIADTKYSIRERVRIFSEGKEIEFGDISSDDVLTVVGSNRKILSIIVTTGHGTLSLKNTTLFEESFLQLNTDIFAMITPEMEMEIPEGTYTLKVANDGWGGTTEIEIVRGETTEVDLDTLKGEGKKKGLISFQIDVENVEVYVDYQKVDHTQAQELTYGVHVLQIKAEGYETWKKYLAVNSEQATLIIELTEDGSETSSTVTETESEAEEESGTETESETEGTESVETTEI